MSESWLILPQRAQQSYDHNIDAITAPADGFVEVEDGPTYADRLANTFNGDAKDFFAHWEYSVHTDFISGPTTYSDAAHQVSTGQDPGGMNWNWAADEPDNFGDGHALPTLPPAPSDPHPPPEHFHFCVSRLFIMALLHAHAHQWVNIVKNASETLCNSLLETRATYFRLETIEKTLSDAIFHQMSFTANYTDDQDDWGLEITRLILPNAKEVSTQLSDPTFKTYLLKELREIATRFTEFLWPRTVYLVLNFREPDDPLPTFYPQVLRSAEYDWWMSFSGHYGYGIFHKRDWDPTMRAHVILPFGHQLFHQIFHRAAYETGQTACFHLVDTLGNPLSELAIHTGATVCAWIIAALKDCGGPRKVDLLEWCPGTKRQEIVDVTKEIYNFFRQILYGLPGITVAEQRRWQTELTRFLRR